MTSPRCWSGRGRVWRGQRNTDVSAEALREEFHKLPESKRPGPVDLAVARQAGPCLLRGAGRCLRGARRNPAARRRPSPAKRQADGAEICVEGPVETPSGPPIEAVVQFPP